MLKKFSIFVLSAALLGSLSAIASHNYSGTITGIQLVDTGSMQFRLTLSSAMTNCDLNFAFVEIGSALFSADTAGLMTAYSQGKTVNLQVNRETSGYCRIYFASY